MAVGDVNLHQQVCETMIFGTIIGCLSQEYNECCDRPPPSTLSMPVRFRYMPVMLDLTLDDGTSAIITLPWESCCVNRSRASYVVEESHNAGELPTTDGNIGSAFLSTLPVSGKLTVALSN